MAGYLLLALSIVAEVIGTTALKVAATATSYAPYFVVVVFYGLAVWLMMLTLRYIPLSVTYAIWSGLGTALVAVVGIVHFREVFSPAHVVGIGLIVAGVVTLNLFTEAH